MKTAIRFYEFTPVALHAQGLLALGAVDSRDVTLMRIVTGLAAERVVKPWKLSLQDRRIRDAHARANNADMRKKRISKRVPDVVARHKLHLFYVKQNICPFSFEPYAKPVVRAFHKLADGKSMRTLSARFAFSELSPRRALARMRAEEQEYWDSLAGRQAQLQASIDRANASIAHLV